MYLHPTSQMFNSLFCDPSFQEDLSCHIAMFFRTSFLCERARAGSSHAPSFTDLALRTSIFLTSIWAHIHHVNSCLSKEEQVCVPMEPLNTQISGFTHHCSCRSSHLFPDLNFLNLLHPRLFVMPFFGLSSLPSDAWPRWKVPPLIQGHMLPRMGNRVVLFLFGVLKFNLVESILTAWTPQVPADITAVSRHRFHLTVLTCLFFFVSENLILHFFLPRFFF